MTEAEAAAAAYETCVELLTQAVGVLSARLAVARAASDADAVASLRQSIAQYSERRAELRPEDRAAVARLTSECGEIIRGFRDGTAPTTH